jgi:hypothetical protein
MFHFTELAIWFALVLLLAWTYLSAGPEVTQRDELDSALGQ